MAQIPGSVPVTGFMAPTDDTDTFAAIDPIWGIDGYRSVATTTVRNAIPDGRRRWGMEVYTQTEAKLWRLNEGPWAGDDTDWTEVTSGGGSPSAPDFSVQFNDGAGGFGGHASFTVDPTTGHVSIGNDATTDPEIGLFIGRNTTGDSAGEFLGLEIDLTIQDPDDLGGSAYGLQASVINDSSGTFGGQIYGGYLFAANTGGGTVSELYGLQIDIGTVTGVGSVWALKTGTGKVELGDTATVGPLQSALSGNLTNYFGSSVQATICSTAKSYALGIATNQSTALFVAVEEAQGIEVDLFAITGSRTCIEIYPQVPDSSTVSAVTGVHVDGEIGASCTVSSYTGFQVKELGVLNASTLTTFKGFDVISPVRAGTGAITTAIGLNIGNMAVTGVTTAYAIKTGTGMVGLGDKLYPATDAAALQTACGLYANTGAPNNANGANGDIYFRADGGALSTVYQRRAGAWVGVV